MLSMLDLTATLFVSALYWALSIGLLFLFYKRMDIQSILSLTVDKYCSDGVLITNRKNHIVYANQIFLVQSGYTMKEILGKNPRIFQGELKTEGFYEKMWNELIENGTFEADFWDKKKNGVLYFKNIKFYLFKGLFR